MLDLEKELNKTDADLDDTPLTFGKYRGKSPDWISDNDPDYLLWLVRETGFNRCSKALINYCKSLVE